jgi:hypothetical protein
MVVGMRIPGAIDLEGTCGLAAISVAKVGADAAVFVLELVENRARTDLGWQNLARRRQSLATGNQNLSPRNGCEQGLSRKSSWRFPPIGTSQVRDPRQSTQKLRPEGRGINTGEDDPNNTLQFSPGGMGLWVICGATFQTDWTSKWIKSGHFGSSESSNSS